MLACDAPRWIPAAPWPLLAVDVHEFRNPVKSRRLDSAWNPPTRGRSVSTVPAPPPPPPAPADGSHAGGPFAGIEAAELAERAARGDRPALGELLHREEPRLLHTVLRMVGDGHDAAEILQDGFAKVVEKFGGFRGEAAVTTWITQVVLNTTLDFLRKRARRAGTVSGETQMNRGRPAGADGGGFSLDAAGAPAATSPLDTLIAREDHRRVSEAILELEPEFRAVLVLRDISELDYAAIGRALQLPLGTVKSRLFRARLMVREKSRDAARAGAPAGSSTSKGAPDS